MQYNANVDQADASGKTPLHCCCWFGNRQSEIALIAKKASVNIQDKSEDTPLHFACQHNYVEIVSDLLRAGADPKLKNQLGKTPEEVAEAGDHGEIVELLQKKEGEDVKKAKVGLTELDKNIVHEQRMLNKTLEDLLNGQEKHSDYIKQLKQKIGVQANNLNSTRQQQQAIKNKLAELEHFAKQIAEKVNILVPKNSSRHRFSFARVPTT
ncbi:ankyrin repeat protein [Tritrichomonas foetus]|uniref:Ankyrin repeat protein n=1 Tax=Tritrichomonas foetus TaxID=1144522 RepID=A0A1J4KXJ7_9EUKA|nr:ankyrin repeat protein [Tritrichomonas foetus]|eukprot:OHT14430.1 ankyrin repeat protein [Tritrichomonas foetus]